MMRIKELVDRGEGRIKEQVIREEVRMKVAAKDGRKPSGRLDRSSSDPFWPVQGFRPPNQPVLLCFSS